MELTDPETRCWGERTASHLSRVLWGRTWGTRLPAGPVGKVGKFPRGHPLQGSLGMSLLLTKLQKKRCEHAVSRNESLGGGREEGEMRRSDGKSLL